MPCITVVFSDAQIFAVPDIIQFIHCKNEIAYDMINEQGKE